MAVKSFTTYKPSEDQAIEMDDYEGNTHTFHLNPSLPGRVILDFMFASGAEDSKGLVSAINSVIDKAIVPDEKEAWEAFINEPRNGVTISVLSEIVGHITSVLSGNPPDRE